LVTSPAWHVAASTCFNVLWGIGGGTTQQALEGGEGQNKGTHKVVAHKATPTHN
jgi:hypothetical protein